MHCRLLQQVSYYKKAGSLATDDLAKAANIVFAEFGLPRKIISDAVINFTSATLRQFLQAHEQRAGHNIFV